MFLHSLPVFLHIKISLRKLEPLYFNKDQVCFLKNDSELQHFLCATQFYQGDLHLYESASIYKWPRMWKLPQHMQLSRRVHFSDDSA